MLRTLNETLDIYPHVKGMQVMNDEGYYMFTHYAGVLKVDGEVGNKKQYDPRAWGKSAEAGMAARVVTACEDLRSTGTSLGAKTA